jgi:hypothetical protein
MTIQGKNVNGNINFFSKIFFDSNNKLQVGGYSGNPTNYFTNWLPKSTLTFQFEILFTSSLYQVYKNNCLNLIEYNFRIYLFIK